MGESRVSTNSLEKLFNEMLASYGFIGDIPEAVALRQAIRKADPAANVELESQRDNLAATVRSLIYQMRRKDPGNHLAGRAMAYLTAKGLQGSVLREDGEDEMVDDMRHALELDCEEALADKRRLTRELDVALCGDGAARQASLCDLIPVAKRFRAAVEATVRCFDALPSNSPAREAPLKINGLRELLK